MGREIKVLRMKGHIGKWSDWGRKVVEKCSMRERERERERERGEEKYGALDREGERNCSFQGLAAFQAVWL